MRKKVEASDRFPMLSVRDLLDAREAYHVHLSQIETVVGTAIGRYRDDTRHFMADSSNWRTKQERPPRTFSNTQVFSNSWPCILVLVKRWYTRGELEKGNKLDVLVPGRLYLPDGRQVPTCVIHVEEDPRPFSPIRSLTFPSTLVGGGYPALTDVQGEERVGSLGCLVTDGDIVYALTSRHVTGEQRPGEPRRDVYSLINGKRITLGSSDLKQQAKIPFPELYKGWPGERVMANVDAGLIRVATARCWTSQVYGLGELGPLFDLHPQNLTLDLIGDKVRAYGAASGVMEGEIQGFFYRYKSVAGFDYVADVLIGTVPGGRSMRTRPGDSGTLWCVVPGPKATDEGDAGAEEATTQLRPLAVQWGGQKLIDPVGKEGQLQLALGTFLSTICRVLDVELVRDHNIGHREYWGKLGHFKVAAAACGLVSNPKLKKLLAANLDRIAYGDEVLKGKLPTFNKKEDPQPFVPLSDVPDLVWRSGRGSRGKDKANHFADMDHVGKGKFQAKTLFDVCKKKENVDARVFAEFYDTLGISNDKERGSLPFRVWQMYDEMVAFLKAGKVGHFVCAGGIMAHYAADACQPLHGSRYHDGRTTKEAGVHAAYETDMLDRNRAELVEGVNKAVKGRKVRSGINGGHEAAVRTVDLMRKMAQSLEPEDIFTAYTDSDGPKAMWDSLKDGTLACMALGSKHLAMLWESAWHEGNGLNVPSSKLKAIPKPTLRKLYLDTDFSPAMWLDEMIQAGIGVRTE